MGVTVTRVIDGDTCDMEPAEQIEGETVTLRFDEECVGDHGRLLVYVVQHGSLVNKRLACEGFVPPAAERYQDQACCDDGLDAISKAQDGYDGGWGECTGSPWIP